MSDHWAEKAEPVRVLEGDAARLARMRISREALRGRLRLALLGASFADWDAGEGTMIETPLDVAVATVVKVIDGAGAASLSVTGSTEEDR